jgi:hypothetical protein
MSAGLEFVAYRRSRKAAYLLKRSFLILNVKGRHKMDDVVSL